MNHRRTIVTVEEFIILSAKLNYQLNAKQIDREALLSLIFEDALVQGDHTPFIRAFDYLQEAYGELRRALGAPAVLHPLRVTSLLVRAEKRPTVIHLLGALLHDKDEDLNEERLEAFRYQKTKGLYEEVLNSLSPEDAWYLNERIPLLTRDREMSFREYITRILKGSHLRPDLVLIKLADRLDNTLDTHMQHPGTANFNFFQKIFEILALPNHKGVRFSEYQPNLTSTEGAILLSQLFKDAIFLSLIRSHFKNNSLTNYVTGRGLDRSENSPFDRLFHTVALAAMEEAEWLALTIMASGQLSLAEQRGLVLEIVEYCQSGGIDAMREAREDAELDGLLTGYFLKERSKERKALLNTIWEDRRFLFKVMIAFIAVFVSFLTKPDYYIDGLDE